jgi:hypothetical protein
MSKHAAPSNERSRRRTLIAASFGVAALALTGAGVYAGLNAVATGTQAVTSGTLSLVQLAGTGSGGLATPINDMAPGDSVSRLVDVTDNGTITAQDLQLTVTGSGSTLLTTSATKGLRVTVERCVLPWAGSTCGDLLGATTVVNNVPVATLAGSPATLVSGTVSNGSAYHYRVVTSLPDQNETTTNGTQPANTIQGLSTTLTFTFDEAQRTATATVS